MFRSPKIVGESEEPLDLASDLTIKEKIMKKFALVLAPIVLSIAVSSAFAGRSADQLMLQEQQNKRVVAEKRKHAEMQAMMEECMKR